MVDKDEFLGLVFEIKIKNYSKNYCVKEIELKFYFDWFNINLNNMRVKLRYFIFDSYIIWF